MCVTGTAGHTLFLFIYSIQYICKYVCTVYQQLNLVFCYFYNTILCICCILTKYVHTFMCTYRTLIDRAMPLLEHGKGCEYVRA